MKLLREIFPTLCWVAMGIAVYKGEMLSAILFMLFIINENIENLKK